MSKIDDNSGAVADNVTPIAAAKGKPAADGSDLPFIRFSGGMVYLKTCKTDRKGETSYSLQVVCESHLRVVGTGGGDGDAFRVLELGKGKRLVKMPTRLIGFSDGWSFLQGHDVQLTQTSEAKRWLAQYLLSDRAYDQHGNPCGDLPKWVVADKPGWLDSGAYLLPNGEIIGDAGNVIVDLELQSKHADSSVSGTVDSWVENVGSLLHGNDTALLAVGASLASVLVGVLGVSGFGIHLYGQSSGGKTSSCYPAMSVLGLPEDRLSTWKSTPLGLTLLARCSNDALMTLDEVKLVEPKHIEAAIYSVFSQRSKMQGSKEGVFRPEYSWRNVVLSTGELAVDAFMRVKTGMDIDAGALVRLVQVRHRPFGNLHGFANGSAFADHLRAASCENFGAVGRWWIECLVKNKDEVRADFSKIKERWNGRGGHGQRQRVAEYFAVIEAALTLPSKTLKLDVKACQSVLDSFYAEWVDDFSKGGNGSHEEALLVERLEAVLSQQGKFLTKTANDQAYQQHELWGYFHDRGDVREYLVFPAVFRDRICGTIDSTVAAKLLAERGLLRRLPSGRNMTVALVAGGHPSKRRFYALSLPVIDDLDAEEVL
ncbi:TPA: DUF927 domain-containing protein [Escherichia coli]|nr:DUF927 domain-containing protein [Salmonella enterica subsp. enterica serovar Braenderup]HAH1156263.1 DUF927 domain-containing protein [Escherichia coli]